MSKITREEVLEILAKPPKNGEFYDFRKMDFSNLDLSGLCFSYANFIEANLTDANFIGANLTDAILDRANLTDANLTRAILTRAKLSDAVLCGAVLRDANLTDANFIGANLTDAILDRANLTDAKLACANLTRADLRHNLNNNNKLLGVTIRGFDYSIYFHPKSDLISIGYRTYPIKRWIELNDDEINKIKTNSLFGWQENELDFWKKNKEKVVALFKIFKGEEK